MVLVGKMINQVERIVAISIITVICLSIFSNIVLATTTIFEKARSAYDNGNYRGALYYLKQSLRQDPKNVSIVDDIGNALQELGNYTGAISFYKKALVLDPHHVGAFVGIGGVLEKLGNQSATIYFKEALKQPITATTSPTVKLERVLALTYLKNYEALKMVEQVLKEKPTINALNTKGVILLYLGNYTGALSIFNHVLTTHPNLTSAIDNKAILFADLGHYKEALKLFNKSVSLNKKDVDAWYNIGNILDHMGNFTGAFVAYSKAQNITPHNKDVLWNEGLTLGVLEYQLGNYSMAVKVYDMLLSKASPTMDHRAYLLQMRNLNLYWEKGLKGWYFASGHPADNISARDYFAKILQITPNDPKALNNFGLAEFYLGNKTAALKFFDRSLAIDPNNYDTLWNKGYALLRLEDYKQMVPVFTKILRLNSSDAAASDDLGISLFKLGNHTAIKYFDKAAELNKTDSDALYNKAFVLQTWGDLNGAISSYEKALVINPNNKDARDNLMLAKHQLLKSSRGSLP